MIAAPEPSNLQAPRDTSSRSRSLPTPATREFANLNFLRAFAVLLVLFGHLSHFHGLVRLGTFNLLLMGALGVQFFFVHTCLVLMLSLERQWHDQGGKKLFVAFMIRRSFRIYPLSITTVTLIALFHLPQGAVQPGHFLGVTPDAGDLLSSLLLTTNLTHRAPILGPIWSLPYEMQMYLFLPGLYLLIRAGRSLWRMVMLWALAIGLGMFLLRFPSIPNPNLFLFIPSFLPGIIAYQLQKKSRPRLPAFLWPLVILALSAFFLGGSTNENWAQKWLTCLLLGLAIPLFSEISAGWLVIPSHFIAKYSYGVYLTHFFSMWLAFDRLAAWPLFARIAIFLVLAAGLPVLFYHALEEPLIRAGKKLADQYAA